jgi:hypothetical protein
MKRSAIYILGAVLLTYLLREAEYIGIRMNTQGQFDKYNTLFIDSNDYDVIVIGSSRAESHFRSDIIHDSTELKTFNAGLLGATMPFIEGALEAYLENSKAPQYVILNIDYHMFIASDDTIRHFPSYFPYLSNDALYERFTSRDNRFPFFKTIPFYSLPYCGTKYLNASLRGYFNSPGRYDTTFHGGYSPVSLHAEKDLDSIVIEPYSPWLTNSSWESLQRIINLCKAKNMQLIFVYSPLYSRLSKAISNEAQIISRLNSIAAESKIQCMDYHLSRICYHKDYFSDLDHLNRQGAEVFSLEFASDLRQYLAR